MAIAFQIGAFQHGAFQTSDDREYASAGEDICGRCGFIYRESKLRNEWTGLKVCFGPGTNGCWEPRHPQDFKRAKLDIQTVRGARPEADDYFLTTNEITVDDL